MEHLNYRSNVVLHAFDWEYAYVERQAKVIAELGYRSVLVSPPMKSYQNQLGTQWWQRYQPQDYRVIDNQLGNTVTFKAMVDALSKFDIQVYVDVVFNHMANESYLRQDLQYPSSADLLEYQARAEYFQKQRLFGDLSQPLFKDEDFVDAFGIEDWKDKWEVQNGRISGGPQDPGLPTLQDSDYVVEQQQSYLKALKKMGVKGFRIDAAKHMTIEHLKKVWTDEITNDVHIFGEIITDGGATAEEYDTFLEPYLKETRLGAYDFPLFNTIFEAFEPKGSFTSLIDPYCFGLALSKRRSITFAITHDIPNNDVFSNLVMSEEDEALAYSYILGRDGGVPLIYTDLDTSNIRNKAGKPRWQDAWKAPEMVNRIAFYNHVHGEKMSVIEANDDILAFSRGDKGLVILNKSKRKQTLSIDWSCRVVDLLTNRIFESKNGKLIIRISGKTSLMLITEPQV
ncbi:alpha-amylase [Vibrio sp. 10N.286.49.B3]|uniref:alpha-amylase family glycosyl hydrolase n=1 Tax=Vibrio sp. 10N.286.49.B3 TaxID=1880855 RepID=UPI000C8485A3|nr:alpha-amylase family glycosyl hydrolase [Vibrio sp. 10N.286.49.B3]PMH43191.1 alpha-amylase [Vibrio sp. 10N.286.49.B3]